MGIFDKFKNRGQNKAKEASGTTEKTINEKTGGKYEDQVDTGQQKAEGAFGVDRDRPEQP
ncbi:antitoxin [Streptomyces sp. TRM68367]|uniref:antitoxin n=1 Tax=Streptomyces sp. TRM68367 TaxID=2758415 RepID=UPI00165A2DDF|nr:antitoxin [Streptomyces sp. TRM68367]MBC9727345.1 antitoxin [Streptomyces sp. TRM68367]